jgi:hypothetical protein
MTSSSNVRNQNELLAMHLQHILGKGGTGRHLSGFRRVPETPGQRAPGGSKQKKPVPLSVECKSSIKMLILHKVFQGQVTKYCKLQSKMIDGSRGPSGTDPRPFTQDRQNPYR